MILVTGATGTIGREIIKQLSAQGVATRALTRDSAKAGTESKIDYAIGDLNDPASLDSALQGVTAALLVSVSSPRRVQQETNFIRAAQRAGLQHIVKISIVGAALDSTSRILQWHGEAEKILAESGLGFTVLRPNYFMQNLFWSLTDIKARGVFNSSLPADIKHSHIDARDIASVAVASLTEGKHTGQTYHLTGPEALTYPEVAARLSQQLGRTVRHDPSPEHYAQFLTPFGMDVQDVLDLDTSVARGEGNGETVTEAVTTITGHPPIRIEQFIRDHLETFKNG